jgi:hypothetical protein
VNRTSSTGFEYPTAWGRYRAGAHLPGDVLARMGRGEPELAAGGAGRRQSRCGACVQHCDEGCPEPCERDTASSAAGACGDRGSGLRPTSRGEPRRRRLTSPPSGRPWRRSLRAAPGARPACRLTPSHPRLKSPTLPICRGCYLTGGLCSPMTPALRGRQCPEAPVRGSEPAPLSALSQSTGVVPALQPTRFGVVLPSSLPPASYRDPRGGAIRTGGRAAPRVGCPLGDQWAGTEQWRVARTRVQSERLRFELARRGWDSCDLATAAGLSAATICDDAQVTSSGDLSNS